MAGEINDTKSISRLNQGFPAYLDWETLRQTGLEHLGKLSGRIWTDHNAHDPGITILEMLCYALMDLGYRTHLPPADIFARDPAVQSVEDNFYTPAQILSCNPVTITDFRKLLVDIDGVRNAWLGDAFTACHKERNTEPTKNKPVCPPCYNGLYHVWIEAEEGYNTDELGKKIRTILMEHRNLCEDFIDVYFLCKKEVGLCVDIELETGIEVDTIMPLIVSQLHDYFSPAPRFYTLQQLLEEKNRQVEEIFAGRPFDISESHGFVDTEEFEAIELRKEIHLSDLYTVILKVPGIRTVRNLALSTDCGSNARASRNWVWHIPKDHVLRFSSSCSEFRFKRNGIAIAIDKKELKAMIDAGNAESSKVLYKMHSPYLDLALPVGNFRSDLGEYQSIQNEFPRVYGINRGGLPSDVSNKRRAQAYQLKAYLLFFDQLLANYLGQLKNMRALFAFKPGAADNHTYFHNTLTDVPDVEKLVRFNAGSVGDEVLGLPGTMLAKPVDRKWLEEAIEKGFENVNDCKLEFPTATFCEKTACMSVMGNLQQDVLNGSYGIHTTSTHNGCWFFYFFSSSGEIAMVSHRFYETEKKARRAGETVQFTASYNENYRSFINEEGQFSFTLELKMGDYSQYLQRICEDDYQYAQRRQQFLDHLLARFAERFTDFSLLSFGFLDEDSLAGASNKQKEEFLSAYPALSSQRGKGYDYKANGWNNSNISGLEKKVYAQAGFGPGLRKHLCNFVVEPLEEYFFIHIHFNNNEVKLFHSGERKYSKESAITSLKILLAALHEGKSYQTSFDENCQAYLVKVKPPGQQALELNQHFEIREHATQTIDGLQKLFTPLPQEDDIVVSRCSYRAYLVGKNGNPFASSIRSFANEQEGKAWMESQEDAPTKKDEWQLEDGKPLEASYLIFELGCETRTILLDSFQIEENDNTVGKKGIHRYEVLDMDNRFKFISVEEFATSDEALTAGQKLLKFLIDECNCIPVRDTATGNYTLQVWDTQSLLAATEPLYQSEEEALGKKKQIHAYVNEQVGSASIQEYRRWWKFRYLLGFAFNEQFTFYSSNEYEDPKIAVAEARTFYAYTPELKLWAAGKSFQLGASNRAQELICEYLPGSKPPPGLKEILQKQLSVKKEAYATVLDPNLENFIKAGNDQERNVVYRLVDKDQLLAFYKKIIPADHKSALALRQSLYSDEAAYDYTTIGMSEHVISEYEDESNNSKTYRYSIQLQKSAYGSLGKFVLFESVKKFTSKEAAMAAFNANYMLILSKAMDRNNYGPGLFISPVPVEESNEVCSTVLPLVYIPEETNELFKWVPSKDIIAELVLIANKYPVRSIAKSHKDFPSLFPCEPHILPTPGAACIPGKIEEIVYYHVLCDEKGEVAWQSVKTFTGINDTWEAFNFFHLLLRYPGNFVAQEDFCYNRLADSHSCNWKVFIREVLAESADRYSWDKSTNSSDKTGESTEAWNGVSKFIAVSQTKNAYKAFLDPKTCAFTFDVSCANMGLLHRCQYDTAGQRDAARVKLWKAYIKGLPEQPAWGQTSEGLVLLDGNKKEWLRVHTGKNASVADAPPCMADFFYDMEQNLDELNGDTIEIAATNNAVGKYIKVQVVGGLGSAGEIKAQLRTLGKRYPVIRKDDGRYYIVIRLEGFGVCDDKKGNCSGEEGDCDCCCIAWESECCFQTCEEAMLAYNDMHRALVDICRYKSYFDCECGPYGIQLDYEPGGRNGRDCFNEVIAFNPQWYNHPFMDCDAIARAKKLVNAEGFHLNEHILLRPPFWPGDTTQQPAKIPTCNSKLPNCNDWKWKGDNEDPCFDYNTDETVFLPGCDPYSFIATAVFPAWPERFKSKENREIIENLLYFETPAHIMLRVLWLNPKEFCRLEYYFKQWTAWRSKCNGSGCPTVDPSAELIRYLFAETITAPSVYDACAPCSAPGVTQVSCFEHEMEDDCSNWKYTQAVNSLYCWNGLSIPPPGPASLPPPIETTSLHMHALHAEIEAVEVTAPKPGDKTTDETVFASRSKKYKRAAKTIVEDSHQNDLAVGAAEFIANNHPTFALFHDVLNDIVRNAKKHKARGRKLLRKQQADLLAAIIHSFLDRMVESGQLGNDQLQEMRATYSQLGTAGFDTQLLMTGWNENELSVAGYTEYVIAIRTSMTNQDTRS